MTDDIPQPDVSELKDYQSWRNAGHDLLTYVQSTISADHAIGITKLFWPDFIVHQNGVFQSHGFSERSFDDWLKHFDGDLSQVEKMINHIHVADLFYEQFQPLAYQNIAYFGHVLKTMWTAALKATFPSRSFQVVGEKDGDFDD